MVEQKPNHFNASKVRRIMQWRFTSVITRIKVSAGLDQPKRRFDFSLKSGEMQRRVLEPVALVDVSAVVDEESNQFRSAIERGIVETCQIVVSAGAKNRFLPILRNCVTDERNVA